MSDERIRDINAAVAAIERVRRQSHEDAVIDKKSKLSSIQLAEFAERQTKLLEKANFLAESAEARAQAAERQSHLAKRHSILANIIAVISLAIAVTQHLAGKTI